MLGIPATSPKPSIPVLSSRRLSMMVVILIVVVLLLGQGFLLARIYRHDLDTMAGVFVDQESVGKDSAEEKRDAAIEAMEMSIMSLQKKLDDVSTTSHGMLTTIADKLEGLPEVMEEMLEDIEMGMNTTESQNVEILEVLERIERTSARSSKLSRQQEESLRRTMQVFRGKAEFLANENKALKGQILALKTLNHEAKSSIGGGVKDYVDFVDCLRGTNNTNAASISAGNVLQLITRPFGMTHWAVVNVDYSSWLFNPMATRLAGIRCTHQPSPWIGDWSHFTILPRVTKPSSKTRSYRQQEHYDVGTAKFEPHYMRLVLTTQCNEDEICSILEFASTRRGGIMSMKIPSFGTGSMMSLDFQTLAGFNGTILNESSIELTGRTRERSSRMYPMYVVALVDFETQAPETANIDHGLTSLTWPLDGECRFQIRFGTSFISLDQARVNLNREVGQDSTMDSLKRQGRDEWNEYLGRVQVESDASQDEKEVLELKTMLYSSLFRALIYPRRLSEIAEDGSEIHGSPYAPVIANEETETNPPRKSLRVSPDSLEMNKPKPKDFEDEDDEDEEEEEDDEDEDEDDEQDEDNESEANDSDIELANAHTMDQEYTEEIFVQPRNDEEPVTKVSVFPGPCVTDHGFWDAYRSVYPFLHLFYPDIVGELLEGWINAIREDREKLLTQWAAPNRRNSMVGAMGEVVIAEGIVNGAITGESAKVGYDYLKRSALNPDLEFGRSELYRYMKYGFVPADSHSSVSLTLNYKLADNIISYAAKKMGDPDIAQQLFNRSMTWDKIWDPETRFFREKDEDGSFWDPFAEFEWMGPYTEGGPWQYRFYVPHDPQGLRKKYGAKDEMCVYLRRMMIGENTISNFEMIHEMKEMQQRSFGQYAHNNQPVHHVLYMFAHAGCPLDGQKWIHHTLRTQYGPFGYAGDEDNGSMSSWYVLSSIGLYALVPGSGKYQVGAPPLFKKVTIKRKPEYGGDLIISRNIDVSKQPNKKFVPSTKIDWNGKSFDLSNAAVTLPFSELLKGGNLVFQP